MVAIALLAVPSSAANLRSKGAYGMIGADVENMLLLIEHGDAFQTNCGTVSKAVVVENSGDKKKVYSHMDLVCSALKLPVDVDMCGRYREALMGHLNKKAAYNLKSLDYSLLCKGMIKIKAEQQKELAEAVVAAKAYNALLKAGSTGTDDADDAAAPAPPALVVAAAASPAAAAAQDVRCRLPGCAAAAPAASPAAAAQEKKKLLLESTKMINTHLTEQQLIMKKLHLLERHVLERHERHPVQDHA